MPPVPSYRVGDAHLLRDGPPRGHDAYVYWRSLV